MLDGERGYVRHHCTRTLRRARAVIRGVLMAPSPSSVTKSTSWRVSGVPRYQIPGLRDATRKLSALLTTVPSAWLSPPGVSDHPLSERGKKAGAGVGQRFTHHPLGAPFAITPERLVLLVDPPTQVRRIYCVIAHLIENRHEALTIL